MSSKLNDTFHNLSIKANKNDQVPTGFTTVCSTHFTNSNDDGGRGHINISFKTINYQNEKVGFAASIERLKKIIEVRTPTQANSSCYSVIFNDWVCGITTLEKQSAKQNRPIEGKGNRTLYTERVTYLLQFLDGVLRIKVSFHSTNIKNCQHVMHRAIIEYLQDLPYIQMETGAQGISTQDDDKAGNTIITRDADQTVEIESGITTSTLEDICSTEPMHHFESITNRWMALPSIEVQTSNEFNTILQTYNLPSFLYSENSAPNMMPFENFMFGKYDIWFKFVVNANKFHVGKVVASVKYDSYQIDTLRNNLPSLLSRPHVIMDLAANNEGMLCVPFKYHRTFVRNASLANSQFGSKAAQYASVTVSILSPLGAVAGAPSNMYIRPFYAIKKASFTGMSYKIPVAQMDGIGDIVSMLDKGLKIYGKISNLDKPYDDKRVQQVIPKPRMNFQSGKGASDSVPLRLDPLAQTTYLNDHNYPEDPISVIDIAKIWGFAGSFDWRAASTEGEELFAIPIEPTWRNRTQWSGTPTPLEYVSSMYQFWSGPLEIRLDFVSNSFHTGSVMLSAEFGRTSANVEQSGSTYTKVFHLGEQKSVSFIVPFIYDTVWRRTSTVPMSFLKSDLDSSVRSGQISTLRANSSALKIRVINRLVPVQSVIQDIKVLVYIRAASNFTLHSPIMSNMLNSEPVLHLNNFPGEYPQESVSTLNRQALDDSMREKGAYQVSHTWMRGKTPNQVVNESTSFKYPTKFEVNPDIKETDYATIPSTSKITTESGFVPRPKTTGTYYWKNHAGNRIVYHPDMVPPDDYTHIVFPKVLHDEHDYYWDTTHTAVYTYNRFYKSIGLGKTNIDQPAFAQMDSGDKEDMDPTSEFNTGVSRENIQTVEKHLIIKDILRRPVCIVANYTIPSFKLVTSGIVTSVRPFFIPCMPPSHLITYGTDANRIYNPLIGRSAHTHLIDLFRFWRGSQRYSIISHRTSGAPIYVLYVPHSGALVSGVVTYLASDLLDTNCPPSSFGLATEVMIPSVNPTMSVEAPYETENNWSLTQCENWERNFSWRDHGDYNAGHLVLWSEQEFTCDIFWSAGDDFEVKNFLGPPTVVAPFSKFALTDNHPTPQMEDFPLPDKTSFASSIFSRISLPLKVAGLSAIPGVGNAIATGYGMHKLSETVEQVGGEIKETNNHIRTTLDNVDDLISAIKSKISGGIDIASSIYNAVINGIIDLLSNMGHWDYKAIALSIVRLLVNSLGIPITSMAKYIPSFENLFRRSPYAQAEDSIEQISESFWNESNIKDAFKVLVAVIGTSIGAVIAVPDKVPSEIVKAILGSPFRTQTVGLANGILRFADTIFNLLKNSVLWIAAYFDPKVRIIQELRMQSPLINEFVKESQILTNELNRASMQIPAFRLRYWTHMVKAYEIQRKLVGLPSKAVSPVLSRICSDVIRHGKENMADLRCSPVKYEPFVLVIQGPAGVGKSNLVGHLVKDMLAAIGLKNFHSDPVHIRTSGSKHWNTYSDQPVVVYDDWLNITSPELVASTLNELYQLKSCATFVPEQAAIEDKKTKATPKIVILLCNNAYPSAVLTNLVSCKEAVYRRRELTVHCQRKAEYLNKNLREMSDEESLSMAHLEFRQDMGFDNQRLSRSVIGYNEFRDFTVKKFVEYDVQEKRNVSQRLNKLMEYFGRTPCNIRDPFSVFYDGYVQVTQGDSVSLRTEVLGAEIQQIAARLNDIEIEDVQLHHDIHNPWNSGPEAQMIGEICLGITAGTVAVGAVLWALRKMRDALRPESKVIARCDICLDEKTIAYVCRASHTLISTRSLDSVHKFCRECMITSYSNGQYNCAVCRSDLPVAPVVDRKAFEATTMLARAYRASNYSAEVLEKFVVWFDEQIGIANWGMFCLSVGIFRSILVQNILIMTPDQMDRELLSVAMTPFFTAASVTTTSLFKKSDLIRSDIAIDITRPKLLDTIPGFDPEAEELLERILTYNNNVSEGTSTEAQRASIERDTRLTINRRLGENRNRYIHYPTGIFMSEEFATFTVQAASYNYTLLNNPELYNEQEHRTILNMNPAREHVLPQADNDNEDAGWAVAAAIGPNRVRHFRNNLPSARDYYPYECNTSQWTGEETHHPICPHLHFRDHPEYINYENGNFVWTSRDGDVPIADGFCVGAPDCPLNDANRDATLQIYFNANKDKWFQYIIKLPARNQVDQIKAFIPKFAWPSWIVMEPIVIDSPALVSDTWWDYLPLNPSLKQLLKVVMVGVATVGVLAASYSLYSWMFPSPVAQIVPSGDAIIRHFKARTQAVQRTPVAQSEFLNSLVEKVNNNYFTIVVIDAHGNEKFLNGCGIKQRLGIIPRHYYEYICKAHNEKAEFYLARPHALKAAIRIAFDPKDFHYSETSDICMFQCPASWNMFRDITKYMATDEELQKKMVNTGILIKPPLRSINYTVVLPIDFKGYVKNQFILNEAGGYNSMHSIKYTYSQRGACGSIICKDNSQRPIVAMHVAGVGEGHKGTGYGVLLTTEMFAEFQCEVSNGCLRHDIPTFIKDIDETKIYLPEDAVVSYVGVLPKDLTPFSPYKSKVTPSEIQELVPWETTSAPAILSMKDDRYEHTISPLVAGCAKHGYLTHNFTTSELEKIGRLRYEQMRIMSPGIIPAEKLTIEEAIVGLDGVDFYDPLHLDTSAGWPLCTTNKTLKKDWCTVTRNENGRVITCEVDNLIKQQIEDETIARQRGTAAFTVFIDTLKDERKPLHKVKKLGGTRVFCASPFAYSVAMRQNFLHLCAAYTVNRWDLKHSVGINLQGPQATDLVSRLLSVGNKIVTIDYSNFGPGYNAGVANWAATNFKRWTKENISGINENELDCLFEEGINSLHCMNHVLYRQHGGSPSGSPITVMINSEVNIMYIMLAWNKLVEGESKWKDFETDICMYVYGDDLIMAVSDKYIETFNAVSITNFFKEYNISATNADKGVEIKPYETIETATFLKHNFAPHPFRCGEWIARLDINSVNDTPLWIKEPVAKKEATLLNAEAGVRAAYGHGKKFFEEYRTIINKALIEAKIQPILLDWHDLDDNFYGKGSNFDVKILK